MTNDLKEGDIVKFVILNNKITPEGLSTDAAYSYKDHLEISEIIELENYPSFSDFKGRRTIVRDGECCLVIKKIGIPDKLYAITSEVEKYTVYEVLTKDNKKRQVFLYNIEKI